MISRPALERREHPDHPPKNCLTRTVQPVHFTAAPCATWNIFSLDARTGKSTTLAKTPSDGQVFNWAFGGALEPYYVVNCDDYPRDGHEAYKVIVFDERFIPIDPKWSVSVGTTATPQCGYKVDAKPFEVTLDY